MISEHMNKIPSKVIQLRNIYIRNIERSSKYLINVLTEMKKEKINLTLV